MQPNVSIPPRRLMLLAATVGLLTLSTPRSPAANAPEANPDDRTPLPAATAFPARLPEGDHGMLLTTLALAAALVGMERLASWRVGVRHRQCSGLEAALR